MESYSRALALAPDDAGILNRRAIALFEAKRYEGAARDFERVLQIAPDFRIVPACLCLSARLRLERTQRAENRDQIPQCVSARRWSLPLVHSVDSEWTPSTRRVAHLGRGQVSGKGAAMER